jgi:hemerythrin-like domain-containing protein
MRPTATLITEHELIQRGLAVLNAISRRMKRKTDIESRDIVALLRFFTQYADELHHTKEEKLLFTALERTRVPDFERMVGSLITQHFLAREFVASMREASIEYRKKSRGAGNRFRAQAEAYITLMKIHICDEDNVLFPRVDQHYSWHQASSLTRKFARCDRSLDARGMTTSFNKTISRLTDKYCSRDRISPGKLTH